MVNNNTTVIRGSHVEIQDLAVAYQGREQVEAVKNASITIESGEFVCILGTTGCGKSTILNVIAGFVPPTQGAVIVDGSPVETPSPDRGMVFQHFALFPWATVLANVCFGPISLGKSKKEACEIAYNHLEMVGLRNFASAYPNELSGGMQQRVGLTRALANNPRLLLMDEPFGALDAQTRAQMQELLLGIWSGSGKTVIFVTHDVDEAIFLADRIVILTARPAQVKSNITVTLPRPRSYDVVTSEAYVAIKREVLELIREETIRASEEQQRISITKAKIKKTKERASN